MENSFIIRQLMRERISLKKHGWLSLCAETAGAEDISSAILAVATALGQPVFGRGKNVLERLTPTDRDHAHPASLSSSFGLGRLPFHVDTSHWDTPCRFIVLGCAKTSTQEVPTLLLDKHHALRTPCELELSKSAVFLVANGRNSFYASIAGLDNRFIRFDPGCMKPVSSNAASALRLFSYENIGHRARAIKWKPGALLVIDNWRMLHGRAEVQPEASNRELIRCNVI